MQRWFGLCVVSLLCLACSTPSRPLEEVLPANLDGWTRAQMAPLDVTAAPELIRQQGLKRALSATYTGPATVRVSVYEMNVATSAFELIQKWRQQDGLAVYKGSYFLVASPESGPPASKLLEALRKQMP
jgi:hypothetical protein